MKASNIRDMKASNITETHHICAVTLSMCLSDMFVIYMHAKEMAALQSVYVYIKQSQNGVCIEDRVTMLAQAPHPLCCLSTACLL